MMTIFVNIVPQKNVNVGFRGDGLPGLVPTTTSPLLSSVVDMTVGGGPSRTAWMGLLRLFVSGEDENSGRGGSPNYLGRDVLQGTRCTEGQWSEGGAVRGSRSPQTTAVNNKMEENGKNHE